ncbi:MAG: AbrB/MazE/SpoVT family DNA-binding domain-containing protein [Nevskia sp.]|nr:AbrB/MazE/SpoVT family DNA-binding domain-containing protein [Nevskia sp.]
MKAKASKWGNSIGVRVPAAIAAEVGLRPGTEVRMVTEGNTLRLIPSQPRRYILKELLAGVTKKNLHGETHGGPSVGAEILE